MKLLFDDGLLTPIERYSVAQAQRALIPILNRWPTESEKWMKAKRQEIMKGKEGE
jgi:hypothetical protein